MYVMSGSSKCYENIKQNTESDGKVASALTMSYAHHPYLVPKHFRHPMVKSHTH